MTTILLILGMSVLAIEISYQSELSYSIKKFLRIDNTPKTVYAMTKLGFWNRLFGKIFLPLNLIFWILASIYHKLIQLVNCPYCLVTHLVFWTSYLYLDNSIFNSLLYGLIAIPITHLIEKIYE